MNKAKCNKELYCQFLLSAQNNFTCTQLSELTDKKISHDAINHWLRDKKMTPKILWEHTKSLVSKESGYLIADDTVLDKPFGENIELSKWQYSGTHHRVVHGIGLETFLWTDELGEKHIPVDYRLYDKTHDGYTKNQHFQEMIKLAHHRGFNPQAILMDAWYTTVANLKTIDSYHWNWVGELQTNRLVSLEPHQHLHLEELNITKDGLRVHLKAYGFIKVFKLIAPNGRIGYFATNDQTKTQKDIEKVYALRWKIEEYHRGLKQAAGISRCQARKGRIQRNHIFCSILSFVALEARRLKTDISWYQTKREIIHNALARYLKKPFIKLPTLAVSTA